MCLSWRSDVWLRRYYHFSRRQLQKLVCTTSVGIKGLTEFLHPDMSHWPRVLVLSSFCNILPNWLHQEKNNREPECAVFYGPMWLCLLHYKVVLHGFRQFSAATLASTWNWTRSPGISMGIQLYCFIEATFALGSLLRELQQMFFFLLASILKMFTAWMIAGNGAQYLPGGAVRRAAM